MSFYGSRKVHYIKADTEEELTVKLVIVSEQLGQKLEVINIYKDFNNGKIVCWYFHDATKTAPPRESKKKVTKKVTKKDTGNV